MRHAIQRTVLAGASASTHTQTQVTYRCDDKPGVGDVVAAIVVIHYRSIFCGENVLQRQNPDLRIWPIYDILGKGREKNSTVRR
jgi:hypothetical protein